MGGKSGQISDCNRDWIPAWGVDLIPGIRVWYWRHWVWDEIGHVCGWLENLKLSHLARIYKHGEGMCLRKCGESQLFGRVRNLDLWFDLYGILADKGRVSGRIYGEKVVNGVVGDKSRQTGHCYHLVVTAHRILHVAVRERIDSSLANLNIYVPYLTCVVIWSDDTRINGDSELVGEGGNGASIGLVEAMRGVIHILSNLHVNRVYANVSNRCRTKRHFVFVGQSLGRQVDSAYRKGHKRQGRHQLDEVISAILQVDSFHVVLLIGQVLNLRSPNGSLGYHVCGLGCPNKTRRGTVTRVVDDCDEKRLVGLTASSHPYAESYWTTAKTFPWTEFVSIGSVYPLSSPEAFKDESLRVIDVRVDRKVHDLFVNRQLKAVVSGGVHRAKRLEGGARGGRVDFGAESAEVLCRHQPEQAVLQTPLHAHHNCQVVVIHRKICLVLVCTPVKDSSTVERCFCGTWCSVDVSCKL